MQVRTHKRQNSSALIILLNRHHNEREALLCILKSNALLPVYKRLKNTNHMTSKKLIDFIVALKSIKLGAFCVLSLDFCGGGFLTPPKVIWIEF